MARLTTEERLLRVLRGRVVPEHQGTEKQQLRELALLADRLGMHKAAAAIKHKGKE